MSGLLVYRFAANLVHCIELVVENMFVSANPRRFYTADSAAGIVFVQHVALD
jgi:hypothetical protein